MTQHQLHVGGPHNQEAEFLLVVTRDKQPYWSCNQADFIQGDACEGAGMHRFSEGYSGDVEAFDQNWADEAAVCVWVNEDRNLELGPLASHTDRQGWLGGWRVMAEVWQLSGPLLSLTGGGF